MDMPTDEIKIKVASNLFADVSKIATAHSYNIALPRTMTNDALFALAYIPTAATGGVTTHRYLTASLHIDGVPIFDGGKAIVTAVDEKGYNINLFWGLAGVLDEIKEEGLKLCDLPLSRRWNEAAMETWVSLPKYDNLLPFDTRACLSSGMDSTVYDTLNDEGKAVADVKPWHVINVQAVDILSKITEVYGVEFDMTDRARQRIAAIWHPLTTLNIKCKDELVKTTIEAFVYETSAGAGDWRLDWNPQAVTTNIEMAFRDLISDISEDTGLPIWKTKHGASVAFDSLHVHGKAAFDFALQFSATWANGCKHDDMVSVSDNFRIPATDNGDGTYGIDAWFYNINDNYMIPYFITDGWAGSTQPELYCDMVISSGGDMQVGDAFSKVRNYPSLKVTEYLTELLVHCGAFVVGVLTEKNALKIATYDDVLLSSGVKVDSHGTKSVAMSLDDVAQRNIYKHADNDDDGLSYAASGEIICSDDTLKDKRDAFSSHFKVPRINYVKLWDVTVVEGSDKKNAAYSPQGDYIFGKSYGMIDGSVDNTLIDFVGALVAYYSRYSTVIYRPKVVEVTFRLSVVDLLKFDMERPIYINQLGAKYAVMSLESDNGENYKAKLIQL